MGIYRFITEEETKQLKSVGDKKLNELFEESLQHDDTLLIESHVHFVPKRGIKGWLGGTTCAYYYSVLHESRAFDGSAYQARYMNFCNNVDRNIVSVYLFGIINGSLKARKEAQDAKN